MKIGEMAGRLARASFLALMALAVAAQAPVPPEYAAGLEASERGDYGEANRIWAKSARKRHPPSVYYRALMLWEGKVGRLNDSTAASWFRFAANKGHVEAQYMLGRVFLRGRGFKRDSAKAREWLAKAAGQGHDAARLQLALLDLPETADPAARVALLREAAEAKVSAAYFDLARAYELGRGIAAHVGEAARWYEAAATAGDARATLPRARLLATGQVPGGDAAVGLALLIEAAGGGDKAAMTVLGDVFIAGGGGLEKSPAIGVAWYERAAELGHDAAMRQLAAWHIDGTHVAKDLDRGADWLRRSAAAGNADSAYRIGKLYDNAVGGTEAHKAAALEWYWRAARKGHGKAMRWLTYLLENGGAGLVDPVDAFYWFSRAEAAGEPTLADRQRLIKVMTPEQMAAAKRKLDKTRAKGLVK